MNATEYFPLRNITTKLRFGFRSQYQLPLFMLWREYYVDDQITYAKILFTL